MFGIFALESLNSKPSNIDDFIFIGTQTSATDNEVLKKLGITHVLNVSDEKESITDFTYKHLPIVDSRLSNITLLFEEAFTFLDQAKQAEGKVLIHCIHGQSRSVAVSIAWKMREAHLSGKSASYKETYDLIVDKRPIAAPNDGFVQQLTDYAIKLNSVKNTAASKQEP